MILLNIFLMVMLKFLKTKQFNYVAITFLSVMVFLMLSSFISRMVIEPPIDNELDPNIVKSNAQEVIQVNVLNACGENGLAGKVRNYLRSRGYDVVEIGNYEPSLTKSIVIDRVGDPKSSLKVAYALGISDSLVYSEVDSNMFLRASVVIGKDFVDLKPFK